MYVFLRDGSPYAYVGRGKVRLHFVTVVVFPATYLELAIQSGKTTVTQPRPCLNIYSFLIVLQTQNDNFMSASIQGRPFQSMAEIRGSAAATLPCAALAVPLYAFGVRIRISGQEYRSNIGVSYKSQGVIYILEFHAFHIR